MRSFKQVVISAAILSVGVVSGCVLYRQERSYESSTVAETWWRAGMKSPGVEGNWARVTVFDDKWRPVPGAKINVENVAGGNEATTDANGVAMVGFLNEGTISALYVNGSRVVDRPYAYFLGTPNVATGLINFEVKLK